MKTSSIRSTLSASRRQGLQLGRWALGAALVTALALAGCAQGRNSSMGGPAQDKSTMSKGRTGSTQPTPGQQPYPESGDNAAGDASGAPGGN